MIKQLFILIPFVQLFLCSRSGDPEQGFAFTSIPCPVHKTGSVEEEMEDVEQEVDDQQEEEEELDESEEEPDKEEIPEKVEMITKVEKSYELVDQKKRRTFRKFTYRGVDLDRLLDLSLTQVGCVLIPPTSAS